METTLKVTMQVKVKVVGGVDAHPSAVRNSIQVAVESISTRDIIRVSKITVEKTTEKKCPTCEARYFASDSYCETCGNELPHN